MKCLLSLFPFLNFELSFYSLNFRSYLYTLDNFLLLVGYRSKIVSMGLFFYKPNPTGLENTLSHFHVSECLKLILFLVEGLDCRVY